ncbi:MAG: glycosyltransferase [Bacteroides sp.]|nr:glycosyltransferase [Bacteroides sp.]
MVSIIIPVYNVSQYLDKCLISITTQTITDLEIILINDGSTDNSGEICEEWRKRDSRIKVYHKKNGGLSDARNFGIDKATGKYLTFIDSDDYVQQTFIEYLLHLIEKYNSDLSVCQYFKFYDKDENTEFSTKKIRTPSSETIISGNDNCMYYFFKTNEIDTVAWRKLYKASLFSSDIRYPEGKYHEDVWTTYKYIAKCKSIAIGNQPLYAYRIRTGSIVNSAFSEKHLDGIEGAIERNEYIKHNYPSLTILSSASVIYSANQCILRLGRTSCSNSEYLDYLKDIYKIYTPFYLKGKSGIKPKIFSLIARYFPKELIKIIKLLKI